MLFMIHHTLSMQFILERFSVGTITIATLLQLQIVMNELRRARKSNIIIQYIGPSGFLRYRIPRCTWSFLMSRGCTLYGRGISQFILVDIQTIYLYSCEQIAKHLAFPTFQQTMRSY